MYKNRLADCELDIMKILWELGPEMTHPQIKEELEHRNGRTYGRTTVGNWLARMRKSRCVDWVKRKGAVYYFPIIERKEYERREMQSFAQRLFQGSFSGVVRAFVHSEDLTEEDAEEVRKIFNEWE